MPLGTTVGTDYNEILEAFFYFYRHSYTRCSLLIYGIMDSYMFTTYHVAVAIILNSLY